jgi:hypothetical protein
MKNSMKEMLFAVIVVSGAQGSSYSFAGSVDDFVKNSLGDAVGGAVIEGMCIVSVAKLAQNAYSVSNGIASYVCPNDAEQAQAAEIAEQLKLLELRKELRNCLITNRKETKKNSLGIPAACDQLAFLLGNLGARDEVTRMAAVFNVFNK